MSAKVKDILTRAGKTFVQAFVSSLGIDSIFGVSDAKGLERVLISILLGALAAGISAVWNTALEWVNGRIEELQIDFTPDADIFEDLPEQMGENEDGGDAE